MEAQGAGALPAGLCLALLGLASVLSIPLACLPGPWDIPAMEALRILGTVLGLEQDAPESWRVVVLELRLSRAVLAWIGGGALAVAGAVYQGLLRNPLADPFTLGVSSGAACGASLAIALGAGALLHPGLGLPASAMCGALLALTAVLLLGRATGGLGSQTLVLAGIVVSTFLAAGISLIKALNEESVASIVFWLMGSFQGRGWQEALLFAPWFVVGGLLVALFARELDLLALGRVQAAQLGVAVRRARFSLLLGASLMAAACVAVAGIIGFVGLVAPHMVRLLTRLPARAMLPACFLAGGALLLWSDVLARVLLSGGAELPVGVVTALLGAPFFCWLLYARRDELRRR